VSPQYNHYCLDHIPLIQKIIEIRLQRFSNFADRETDKQTKTDSKNVIPFLLILLHSRAYCPRCHLVSLQNACINLRPVCRENDGAGYLPGAFSERNACIYHGVMREGKSAEKMVGCATMLQNVN